MTFEYVPGALFPADHAGLGLYIRYGRTNVDAVTLVQRSHQHCWLKCPDRELLIVNDSNQSQAWRPIDGSWDEYLSFNPFTSTANDFGFDWIMENYFQHQSTRYSLPIRKPGFPRPSFKVMSDSGGFQLGARVVYLDPAKVQLFYNDHVDVGVVLDLPSIGTHNNTDLLIELAKIQRRNTEVMLRYKAPGVRLMNVFHGLSQDHKRRFRNIVEVEGINAVSISDIYNKNIHAGIRSVWDILLTGTQYDHYHLLGIYNIAILPLFIRLANLPRFQKILFTSDASTHLQSANSRLFHIQRAIDRPMERLRTGVLSSRNHCRPLTDFNTLPCACPVCSRLRYSSIFTVMKGAASTFLLMMHNAFVTVNYVHDMNQLAATLDWVDYRNLVADQLKNHKSAIKDSLSALDYLRELSELGPDKADKRYHYYLVENMFGKYQGAAILGKDLIDSDNNGDGDQTGPKVDTLAAAAVGVSPETLGVSPDIYKKSLRESMMLYTDPPPQSVLDKLHGRKIDKAELMLFLEKQAPAYSRTKRGSGDQQRKNRNVRRKLRQSGHADRHTKLLDKMKKQKEKAERNLVLGGPSGKVVKLPVRRPVRRINPSDIPPWEDLPDEKPLVPTLRSVAISE